MRTMNRLIVCCALLAFCLTQLYGNEKDLTQADGGGARVFNVLKYGAVGDDKTDNTEALSDKKMLLHGISSPESSNFGVVQKIIAEPNCFLHWITT